MAVSHINSAKLKKNILFKKSFFPIKCRSVKTKCFLLSAIVIIIYFIISYKIKEISVSKDPIKNNLELQNVIIHLDLKGSPPKLGYLKSLLPKLLYLGVTGLLIEYEDMFPYEGELVNLSAINHYDAEELHRFVALAVRIGIDVIPLVQTFGHMEHALKLREFQNLREIPLFPDSICPSKVKSRKLIQNMLEQIIKFHQNIYPLKYLHIGADEVYHINECKKCLSRSLTETDIYLNHVDIVLKMVKAASPSTTVLIWDDMFRKIPVKKWNDIMFDDRKLEPVYWQYKPEFAMSHFSMLQYHKKFQNIWVASAFKGADGRTATFPDLTKRLWNHLSWLKSILDYKFGGENEVYNFSGIILTGWSRYSHMDPPCELLPVSIPSLYLNLLLLKKFKYIDPNVQDDTSSVFTKYLHEDFIGNLHCTETINIKYFDSTNCYFVEAQLFNIMKEFDTIITNITSKINSVKSDLSALEFYSKTNNLNLNSLEQNIKWCNTSMNSIKSIKNKLLNNLPYYYDSVTVDEYVNYKFYNPTKLMNKLIKILQTMYKIRSWKRRPYTNTVAGRQAGPPLGYHGLTRAVIPRGPLG